jgi:asparagine synthase (glutamine-hydrolysing)
MCGIAGVFNRVGGQPDPELVRRMCLLLQHRGPDGEGFYQSGPVALGHRRLSIIDLSEAGAQPMTNEEGTLWLVYNGEIYNYADLRVWLTERGHRFRSQTDTEVILHAYEEEGPACLHRFVGMFSFALWDERQQRLFCARDHFGIKPFYYALTPTEFVFASEIKAILCHPAFRCRQANLPVVLDYLHHGFLDHTDETFFHGIRQIPPAHYLVIDHHSLSLVRYWNLPTPLRSEADAPAVAKAAEHLLELLTESVRRQLRSDVPVGSCLSGGLDSTTIVVLVNRLLRTGEAPPTHIGERQKTFTARFDDPAYDEWRYTELVVRQTGVEAHSVFPRGEGLVADLERLLWHQEEPFGSTSVYAQWTVMALARRVGVKVLLDGQGGDEILGGYTSAYPAHLADLLRQGRVGAFIRALKVARSHGQSPLQALAYVLSFLTPPEIRLRLKEAMGLGGSPYVAPDLPPRRAIRFAQPGSCVLDDHLIHLLVHNLPALLHYEDRNAMAFSLEARVPFLDPQLVEFCLTLPAAWKVHGPYRKVALRLATAGLLPEPVRWRVDKVGFATPEEIWLRTVLRQSVLDLLASRPFRERGYFKVDAVKRAFQALCQGQPQAGSHLWRVLCLEWWAEMFLDRDSLPAQPCVPSHLPRHQMLRHEEHP